MQRARGSKNEVGEEYNAGFRTPQAVISRRIQMQKMKALQNESHAALVRSRNSESPASPEKNDKRTVPVSLPIIHFHDTDANQQVFPLNLNTTAPETGNMDIWGRKVLPSESDSIRANFYYDKQKELAGKTSAHGINPNTQMTASHGTYEQIKNITKDYGNTSGCYPSNVARTNQQQRGEMRQQDSKTADGLKTSIPATDVELLMQFNSTVNDNSITDETAYHLRNVRKAYHHAAPTPTKHNLPVETMPSRHKYKTMNTPNTPVVSPSDKTVNTVNNTGLTLNEQVISQQNISNLQSISHNQMQQSNNVKKDVCTQTYCIDQDTKEKTILDIIKYNKITVDELRLIIDSRANDDKPAVENSKDDARAESDVVEILDDEENQFKLDFTKMVNDVEEHSKQNKIKYSYSVLDHMFRLIGHNQNLELDKDSKCISMFKEILDKLNNVSICKCCVENTHHTANEPASELQRKRKRPDNTNETVAEPELSTPANCQSWVRPLTPNHVNMNLQQASRPQAPVENTHQVWNSNQNLNKQLPLQRDTWHTPPTGPNYPQAPQEATIRTRDPRLWSARRLPNVTQTEPYPNPLTHTHNLNGGYQQQFPNQLINIPVHQQEEYSMGWEAQMSSNYAGHKGYTN